MWSRCSLPAVAVVNAGVPQIAGAAAARRGRGFADEGMKVLSWKTRGMSRRKRGDHAFGLQVRHLRIPDIVTAGHPGIGVQAGDAQGMVVVPHQPGALVVGVQVVGLAGSPWYCSRVMVSRNPPGPFRKLAPGKRHRGSTSRRGRRHWSREPNRRGYAPQSGSRPGRFGPGNRGVHRQDVGCRQLVGKPDAHRGVPAGDNQAAEMGLLYRGGLGWYPDIPTGGWGGKIGMELLGKLARSSPDSIALR